MINFRINFIYYLFALCIYIYIYIFISLFFNIYVINYDNINYIKMLIRLNYKLLILHSM